MLSVSQRRRNMTQGGDDMVIEALDRAIAWLHTKSVVGG